MPFKADKPIQGQSCRPEKCVRFSGRFCFWADCSAAGSMLLSYGHAGIFGYRQKVPPEVAERKERALSAKGSGRSKGEYKRKMKRRKTENEKCGRQVCRAAAKGRAEDKLPAAAEKRCREKPVGQRQSGQTERVGSRGWRMPAARKKGSMKNRGRKTVAKDRL